MNVSRIFIERPIMTALVTFAILLFGIVGYRALPVAALPSVDYPTIQVGAALPGADPETMASAVATPLERQFSTIAGIESMSSTNSQGSTSITIQFALDRNIDAAAQDVQAAIAKAGGLLPPDMPHPPSYQKVNPAEQAVIYLGLSSDTMPMYTVDEYAETLLAQRISMAGGVSRVQVFGAAKYAVRVQLNPESLSSLGIGIDEVQRAIQAGNVNTPTGKLYGDKQAFTLQTKGQLTNAAAYRPLIVAWREGVPVRLEQLGQVIDSVETERAAAWMDGKRGMILAIQRQPGTNTVQVVDNVKALLSRFSSRDSSRPASGRHLRRVAIHPPVRQRREVHAGADHLPGGDGHLPVPAQPLGHLDSRRGGAALHHRHFRRHVPAGLQPEQSVADGPDAVGRLRGG